MQKNKLHELPELPEGDVFKVKGELNFSENGLLSLPSTLGCFQIGRNFDLRNNNVSVLQRLLSLLSFTFLLFQIVILPMSIGDLHVGGDLWLSGNQLKTLPRSFHKIKVLLLKLSCFVNPVLATLTLELTLIMWGSDHV